MLLLIGEADVLGDSGARGNESRAEEARIWRLLRSSELMVGEVAVSEAERASIGELPLLCGSGFGRTRPLAAIDETISVNTIFRYSGPRLRSDLGRWIL